MNQTSSTRIPVAAPIGDRPSVTVSRHAQSLAYLIAAALFLAVSLAGFGSVFAMQHPWAVDFVTQPSVEKAKATGLILFDSINEHPHFAAVPTGDSAPICSSVPQRYVPALTAAFGLMRGAPDGAHLYNVLVSHDVCVQLANIPYNGGYATSWRETTGRWVRGSITLDEGYIRSRQADVVAAMLVHEATHIERAIDGTSCDDTRNCETLANGVELDEEVAAHAAEARFWIEAYGKNGKRFTIGADYGENQLASAYDDGPIDFRAYVRKLRSDPRDGKDL
ncbi:MAG TPA: hypothetical protein VFL82_09625 [Thermomicrobiales bacterium]|nr:hypothetical protein [Thermomicrobiales bacterium]